MGCDIHLVAERRRNGKWERVHPPKDARNPWLVQQAEKSPESFYATWAERQWYNDRNYGVFAILAGVRNYEDAAPIAQPRGIPDDLSDEVRALITDDRDEGCDDLDLGDHSQSWLTLAELQAYPWESDAQTTGCVTLAEFMARVTEHGMALPVRVPKHPYTGWCGDIGGPKIVVREASDVIAALQGSGLALPVGERTYVRDVWRIPASVDAGAFTSRVMPALATLGAPEDVRIVFGFDS